MTTSSSEPQRPSKTLNKTLAVVSCLLFASTIVLSVLYAKERNLNKAELEANSTPLLKGGGTTTIRDEFPSTTSIDYSMDEDADEQVIDGDDNEGQSQQQLSPNEFSTTTGGSGGTTS